MENSGLSSLNELSQKTFKWFEEQASNKKDAPSSIINKFRNAYDGVKTIETNNALGVNLYLAITLVEFLRHIIVHKSGIVRDRDKFKERILKKCGLFNSGNPSQENMVTIDRCFGTGEYKNTITLLEIPMNLEIPFDIHINVFDVLSGYLMAYIHNIYDCIELSHNN